MRISLLASIAGVVLCACLLSGCGSRILSPEPPAVVKVVVLRAAVQYVACTVRGDYRCLRPLVAWNDYLKHQSIKGGMNAYQQRLQRVKNRWSAEENPLMNLDVKKIDIDENDATVVFGRAEGERFPEFSIQLYWTGGGWLIYDDSLFGDDELIEQLTAEH